MAELKKNGLTPKQEKYAQMYVKYGNKTVAYKKAYNTENMKPESINRKAFEVHENGNVTARIAELQAELEKRNAMTLDRVIKSIAQIATFDIAEIYDDKGNIKPIHEIPKSVRIAIQSIKTFELGDNDNRANARIRDVKLLNKLDAFEKLMKYFGGYEKDNKQKANPITGITFEVVNKDEK